MKTDQSKLYNISEQTRQYLETCFYEAYSHAHSLTPYISEHADILQFILFVQRTATADQLIAMINRLTNNRVFSLISADDDGLLWTRYANMTVVIDQAGSFNS